MRCAADAPGAVRTDGRPHAEGDGANNRTEAKMAKQIKGVVGAGGRWSKAAVDAKTTPEASSGGDTTATVGGSATAVGDNTLATGDVSLKMVDRGAMTTVRGEAKATASATGGDTYAAAETYADVTGADFVLTRTVKSSGSGSDSSTASSTTKVIAFTFDKFDFKNGPIELDFTHERNSGGRSERLELDGNAARISAEATAKGDASATLTQTDAFTTDDFSSVTGDAYGFLG